MKLQILVALLLLCGACVTTRQKDASGSGDERLDEGTSGDVAKKQDTATAEDRCGPDGKGNVVLYDARTAEVVPCALVLISRENAECVQRCRMLAGDSASASSSGGTQCPDGTTCSSERVFNGRSNKSGQLTAPSLGSSKLTAVVEGYALTQVDPSTDPKTPTEVELLPTTGFILKLIDQDGNYLNGVSATFAQGVDVIAQLRSNELANVYLQPSPFGNDPVTVTVDGFQPAEVKAVTDLGDDGHTLTLNKKK
ncbi:MAG: hypothetical protein ACJ790_09170 [Myxococcaceae bacterium]